MCTQIVEDMLARVNESPDPLYALADIYGNFAEWNAEINSQECDPDYTAWERQHFDEAYKAFEIVNTFYHNKS